jgi:hypothetical protein
MWGCRRVNHKEESGEKRISYKLLVRKPERKRTLGRPRRRWTDNIKMDHADIELCSVDWIGMAQDRDRELL